MGRCEWNLTRLSTGDRSRKSWSCERILKVVRTGDVCHSTYPAVPSTRHRGRDDMGSDLHLECITGQGCVQDFTCLDSRKPGGRRLLHAHFREKNVQVQRERWLSYWSEQVSNWGFWFRQHTSQPALNHYRHCLCQAPMTLIHLDSFSVSQDISFSWNSMLFCFRGKVRSEDEKSIWGGRCPSMTFCIMGIRLDLTDAVSDVLGSAEAPPFTANPPPAQRSAFPSGAAALGRQEAELKVVIHSQARPCSEVRGGFKFGGNRVEMTLQVRKLFP